MIRGVALLAFLASISAPGAKAEFTHVVPAPANAWQVVTFRDSLPGNNCAETVAVRGVTRSGDRVLVDYAIVPLLGSPGCFIPAPLSFQLPVGTFPPGTYSVQAFGSRGATSEASFVVAPPPAKQAYARIEILSGDRQILTPGQALAPVKVRARDGQGRPIAGLQLAMMPALGFNAPLQVDAFGFAGFNTEQTLTDSRAAYGFDPRLAAGEVVTTDANGVATMLPLPYYFAPGAFLFGIGPWPDAGAARPRFASFVVATARPNGDPRVVVEYVHEASGRYFITQYDTEIAMLDAGVFEGWKRSVGSFVAYADGDARDGTVPVCRLFSAQLATHFFSASAAECDEVLARWPDVWTLETRSAFRIGVPDPSSGACPTGSQPVYRLLNAQGSVNHRYVTDPLIRDAMVSRGWIAEGAGPYRWRCARRADPVGHRSRGASRSNLRSGASAPCRRSRPLRDLGWLRGRRDAGPCRAPPASFIIAGLLQPAFPSVRTVGISNAITVALSLTTSKKKEP